MRTFISALNFAEVGSIACYNVVRDVDQKIDLYKLFDSVLPVSQQLFLLRL